MDGGIDENAVLDYVVFHVSSTQNSYEAVICSKDVTEKLAIGPLDQLALHLREGSNPSGNSFKLQVTGNLKGSSWFTKSTIARFLHIVNTPEPETVKAAKAIQTEMSQLEETKKFHITLYAKGHPDNSGDGTTDCSEETALTQKVKVETALSDATKNELLRAVDLRFSALEEEFTASCTRLVGDTCSTKQIYDLVEFSQHFGEVNLRNCLLKYLTMISKDQPGPIIDQFKFSTDPRKNVENKTVERNLQVQQVDIVKPANTGISPAKIAQAERKSSTESEESSVSSDEERASAERSRSLNRAAPARRSASPMRRIQIGRSGSHRSTALAIRSLNYYPARERIFNRDADGTNSGDEEPDQPAKKPENTVRRMSVQDAISLFESKQKDKILDVEKRKPSVEISVSTSKSVLRRWSSGMGDSFTHSSNENASDAGVQNTSKNLPVESEEKSYIEVKAGSNSLTVSNQVEATEVSAFSEVEMITSPLADGSAEMVIPKAEEIITPATASAEWNRQKEIELNQLLMKMTENKPGKYRSANAGKIVCQDMSSEQKGGSYSLYKEKRDEKLRAENARLRATKEARFKVMQESLEQSKAEMTSKTGGISGKQNSLSHSQKPRRNLSPPVLPKNEISKPTGSRKATPRSASLSGTRGSHSSGPLPKTTVTPPSKSSPRTISTNSTPNRRTAQSTPSPAKASLRTETPPPQQKGTKGIRTDVKPISKNQVEKQQKAVTTTTRSVKTKSQSASGDDSVVKSSKPSFYNKVTKKSSVVPVESKPFLRKSTGNGPGVGTVPVKTKISRSDVSSKNSGDLVQAEETEPTAVTAESKTKPVEHVLQTQVDADSDLEVPPPVVNDINHETGDNSDTSFEAVENKFNDSVHLPIAEIQPDEDTGISSAAWVEVEHPEVSASCDNGQPGTAISPGPALVASTSPRVRHSLSQMLLADSSEPDTIEWGNAENPPAFVYQKDAPKGLKRLLKFARKSKGDANAIGWSSPSVFSEGEDDTEESKAASKRSSDNLLRKAALQATAYGHQKNMLSESFDSESKRALDYRGMQDILSAQSSMSHAPDKLRDGHISSTVVSTKATRSFFSLSTFRSGKSSEPKLR